MFVERPAVPIRSLRGTRAKCIRETLSNGKAVAIPINGETYAVVRNRVCSSGQVAAKQLHARLRTSRSVDGLSVLVWLEPKPEAQS